MCDYEGCNFEIGVCFGLCEFGYYGDKCKGLCNLNCEYEVCDCIIVKCFGCEIGFYGYNCIMVCSIDCFLW